MLVPYVDRIKAFLDQHQEHAADRMNSPLFAHVVSRFYRLTIDMRLLNQITVDDQHPLPKLMDVIDRFYGNKHFASHDVQDAFWAVPLKESDRHKTAFEILHHLLEWNVIPQGCKNGAVMFARVVAAYFGNLSEGIGHYQDDLFVHNNSIRAHLADHRKLFDRAREASMVFSLRKSHFNYHRLRVLGHIVTSSGRTPDPEKIAAVLDLKDPETDQQIMHFLGLIAFNRDYIHRAADLTAPLREVLKRDKKKVRFAECWGDEQSLAIRDIKHRLTSAPVLQIPDPDAEFRIHVDTCNTGYGIGATLLQRVVRDVADGADRESKVSREEIAKARSKAREGTEPMDDTEEADESSRQLKTRQTTKGFLAQMAHDDKCRKKAMDPPEYPPTWEDDWRPVAYFSQSINHPVPSDDDADNHRAEWWATECEALGLHNAIMHWAMYLRNGKPFSVVVDHQALLYLVKGQGRLTNRKILNMLMNLQEFRFSVIYRDGLRHLDADAISRLLHYQDNGETLMLEMNGSSVPGHARHSYCTHAEDSVGL
jgi:hypothetical protein